MTKPKYFLTSFTFLNDESIEKEVTKTVKRRKLRYSKPIISARQRVRVLEIKPVNENLKSGLISRRSLQ